VKRRGRKYLLVIHGGASSGPEIGVTRNQALESMARIVASTSERLARGGSAVDAVAAAVELLENDPIFNAGRGSKIQSDGKIRMSSALMDGARRRFAGCVNVEGVKNPIRLAQKLLPTQDRVLSCQGAQRFARAAGLKFASNYTPIRVEEYRLQKARKMRPGKTGTVGAVALDLKGRLAAGTSTGGRGFEYPFRVSDTPTAAGNYANGSCAISATGVGEQIVEAAVAATLCAQVEGGAPLSDAARRMIARARAERAHFGLIGVDRAGNYCASTSTPSIAWAAAGPWVFEVHI
jgi:L-asparaginase